MSVTAAQLTLEQAAWMPPEPSNADERTVLEALRPGHVRTREELGHLTGLPDRTARDAIHHLRQAGWPIASTSAQAGYRLTWQGEDLEAMERDLTARALSVLRVRRAIRLIRQRRVA
jgi:hypothetical protein